MVMVVVAVTVAVVVMVALSRGDDLLVVVVVRPGFGPEAHFRDGVSPTAFLGRRGVRWAFAWP